MEMRSLSRQTTFVILISISLASLLCVSGLELDRIHRTTNLPSVWGHIKRSGPTEPLHRVPLHHNVYQQQQTYWGVPRSSVFFPGHPSDEYLPRMRRGRTKGRVGQLERILMKRSIGSASSNYGRHTNPMSRLKEEMAAEDHHKKNNVVASRSHLTQSRGSRKMEQHAFTPITSQHSSHHDHALLHSFQRNGTLDNRNKKTISRKKANKSLSNAHSIPDLKKTRSHGGGESGGIPLRDSTSLKRNDYGQASIPVTKRQHAATYQSPALSQSVTGRKRGASVRLRIRRAVLARASGPMSKPITSTPQPVTASLIKPLTPQEINASKQGTTQSPFNASDTTSNNNRWGKSRRERSAVGSESDIDDNDAGQEASVEELKAIFTEPQDGNVDSNTDGQSPADAIEATMLASGDEDVDESEEDSTNKTGDKLNGVLETKTVVTDENNNVLATDVDRLAYKTDGAGTEPEGLKSLLESVATHVGSARAQDDNSNQNSGLNIILNEYQSNDASGQESVAAGQDQDEYLMGDGPLPMSAAAYEYAEKIADRSSVPRAELNIEPETENLMERRRKRSSFRQNQLSESPVDELNSQLSSAKEALVDEAMDMTLSNPVPPMIDPASIVSDPQAAQILSDEGSFLRERIDNRLEAADDIDMIQRGLSKLSNAVDKLEEEPLEGTIIAAEEDIYLTKARQELHTLECVRRVDRLSSGCGDVPLEVIRGDNLTYDLNEVLLARIFTTACDWHEVCYKCGEAYELMASDCDTEYLELVRRQCNEVIDELSSAPIAPPTPLTASGCEATARRLVVALRNVRSFYHKSIPQECSPQGAGTDLGEILSLDGETDEGTGPGCIAEFLNVAP